jgi:hypothetical protein
MFRSGVFLLLVAFASANMSPLMFCSQPGVPQRAKPHQDVACRAAKIGGWAKHDEVLFDAAMHGWDKVFNSNLEQQASLMSLRLFIFNFWAERFNPLATGWNHHDDASFQQLDAMNAAWARHDEVLLEKAMAFGTTVPRALEEGWERHDTTVLSALTGHSAPEQARQILMPIGWATHDEAVWDLTMKASSAAEVGWDRNDLAILSLLQGEPAEARTMHTNIRRNLMRTKSNLEELTTTLIRGLDGYDQDTLFEGGAAGYSVWL